MTAMALAAILAGCAETGGIGIEWIPISENEFKYAFDAPGLAGGAANYQRALDRRGYHKQYSGEWMGPGPLHASAHLARIIHGAD